MRHGQCLWQVLHHNDADSPLTSLGRWQAHHAGNWLRHHEPTIGAIVTSTLQRAVETARIVSLYLNLPVLSDPDWCEYEHFRPGWYIPEPVSPWDPHPQTEAHPEYQRFTARVHAAFRRAREALPSDQTLLVVAHGGTLATLLRVLSGAPTLSFQTSNAAFHVLTWSAESWRSTTWHVEALNFQEHLPPEQRSA